MQGTNLHKMGGQWLFDHGRKHGDPILVAFAFAHDNVIGSEINVFDAQP